MASSAEDQREDSTAGSTPTSTSLPIGSTTRSSTSCTGSFYPLQPRLSATIETEATETAASTTTTEATITEDYATVLYVCEEEEGEEVMEVVDQVLDVVAEVEVEAETDWDSKPPARRPSPPQVHYTELFDLDDNDNNATTATVVDYDVHPSDLLIEAAPAELMGHDYSHTHADHHSITTHDHFYPPTSTASSADIPNSTNRMYPYFGNEDYQDESLGHSQVTDVDVIESGPMEKATVEAWSASTSGQAHVLIQQQQQQNQQQEWDTKPSERSSPSDDYYEQWDTMEAYATTTEYGTSGDDFFGTTTIMDGEAEVVDISEEVHPAELVEGAEATAEAELVGSDFNTAIGIPSGSQHFDYFESHIHSHTTTAGSGGGGGGVDGTIAHADIIVEESNRHHQSGTLSPQRWIPPREARATLVHPQSEQPGFDVNGGTATVVMLEPSSSSRSRSDPLPATTVTVLEDPYIPALPPGVSFRDHVKSEPYSGTTTRVQQPVQDQVFRETAAAGLRPEWERLPSFGGESSVLPAPMLPPVASPIHISSTHSVPSRQPIASESSISSRNRSRGSNSSTSDSTVPGFQMKISSGLARGASSVIETLFGNGIAGIKGNHAVDAADLAKMGASVLPRTLLPSSVIFSETTRSWVATVNTNQKALETNNVEESSKSLRAFSVPTQKQAMALARAWAPPQMHPFASNPTCLICEVQFTVFRRASHCRNCGVCICGPCSLQWPAKMLPVTYNIKKETTVAICKACDWLCSEFRLALLQGNLDKAVALYSTGNINLTTPFANVKGELFYPVHCAVLGGSLALVKWLVDEHCCPLRSIRISNGKTRGSSGGGGGSSYTPILTSKGRSLLGIAITNGNIGIVRYLVVEKRMLLSAEKSLSMETLIANLDLVLRILPESAVMEQALDSCSSRTSARHDPNDLGDMSAIMVPGGADEDYGGGLTDDNICIVCFDATINCVFTPCGHQICCLTCGNNISRCPVCTVECTPMRVFKP